MNVIEDRLTSLIEELAGSRGHALTHDEARLAAQRYLIRVRAQGQPLGHLGISLPPNLTGAHAMDVTVIIAASRTSTIDTDSYPTIGDIADVAAAEHETAGTVFTLKVDGAVFTRDTPAATLTANNTIELIEYTDGDYRPVNETTPEDPPVGTDEQPPANVGGDPVASGIDATPAAD